MHGPATVGWLLVAVCLLTAGACLLRAVPLRDPARTAARLDAGMALVMAAMAWPGLGGLVPELGYRLAFTGAFAALGVGALVLVARRAGAHHLHHLLGAAAMVYATLTAAGGHGGGAGHGGHGGHGEVVTTATAGVPLLTGVLAVYFGGYVLRCGWLLLPAGAPTPTGTTSATGTLPRVPLRNLPEVAVSCRLAMGAGMLTMLLIM